MAAKESFAVETTLRGTHAIEQAQTAKRAGFSSKTKTSELIQVRGRLLPLVKWRLAYKQWQLTSATGSSQDPLTSIDHFTAQSQS